MAAITLNEQSISAKYITGAGSYTLAAGKNLKIETSPTGEELLNSTVPAGKQWAVMILVKIEETDA